MGRDNHPRERQARQLERKNPKRATYDRILIVSEGEKTEVNYFGEIRRQYRLSSAHICICQSDYGTTPEKVVQYAIARCGETSKWERVYCVIDRDDHDYYTNALASVEAHDKKLVNDLGEPIRFTSIPSNPSFELWLLLHFQDSEAFLHRDDVIRALRAYIPGYSKGKTGTFAATMDRLAVACERTERLRGREERRGMTNPCTHVDELVQALRVLRGD
ncbi:hypothetical protein bAD24_III12695 [Burkholderia sp. AD24]|nr:hypothetical protein bAD24_III12695 [Burkholderia sp. AD24]